jgi:hypothetical protein
MSTDETTHTNDPNDSNDEAESTNDAGSDDKKNGGGGPPKVAIVAAAVVVGVAVLMGVTFAAYRVQRSKNEREEDENGLRDGRDLWKSTLDQYHR